MYDKYFHAKQFTLGLGQLPKHKGILFTGATSGSSGTVTLAFYASGGVTLAGSLLINSSPYIFPMQVYSISALPTGITGWYIN